MRMYFLLGLIFILASCSGTPEPGPIPTLMELGALPSPSATAAPGRALIVGEPVSGTLALPGEVQAWQFEGRQGERVTMDATAAGLTLALTLQTPDGTVLTREIGSELILPMNGVYQVFVRSEAGVGDYTLLVAEVEPAPSGPTTTPLPQVVGVPTPTPPYASLGAFISRLSPGSVVDGAFDQPEILHVYLFDGLVGQYVNLEMIRVSGTVDPALTLYSPSGEPIAFDDNSGGSRAARLRNIRLFEDGLYSVQSGNGGFPGSYRLSFFSASAPFAITPNAPEIVPTATLVPEILTPTLATAVSGNRLEDHVPVLGEISREGDFDRFPVFAAAEEVITIGAAPLVPGALRLRLEVYGPAGDLVASASSGSSPNGDAVIAPLRIESTGAYVIFVTAENPGGVGRFIISYGRGSTRENVMKGELVPNQPNTSTIDRRGLRDVWSIYLNAGDIISAAVTPNDNVFDPILEVVRAADGTLLGIDDNGGGNRTALLSDVRIAESGLYHLRVRAAQAASTGGYALVWRYVNLAPSATPPFGTVRLLSVDDTAPDNQYRFYPFQGRAGQRVEIRVVTQPGTNFDPVAALLGPDGQVVAEGDDSDNSLNPRFVVDLPVDGTYLVRVNGYLRGGPFELTVTELVAFK